MIRVFALRICQFVGFAIPWCIQCICYQTRAKLSKDRNVNVRVDLVKLNSKVVKPNSDRKVKNTDSFFV